MTEEYEDFDPVIRRIAEAMKEDAELKRACHDLAFKSDRFRARKKGKGPSWVVEERDPVIAIAVFHETPHHCAMGNAELFIEALEEELEDD